MYSIHLYIIYILYPYTPIHGDTSNLMYHPGSDVYQHHLEYHLDRQCPARAQSSAQIVHSEEEAGEEEGFFFFLNARS